MSLLVHIAFRKICLIEFILFSLILLLFAILYYPVQFTFNRALIFSFLLWRSSHWNGTVWSLLAVSLHRFVASLCIVHCPYVRRHKARIFAVLFAV